MKYFAAIQSILDASKIEAVRQPHVAYLEKMVAEGKIHIRGKFSDGLGGLTIYKAETIEDARKMAESDPFVSSGARRLEFHEWEMKPRPE
jgi:uncharacterized protein YciI